MQSRKHWRTDEAFHRLWRDAQLTAMDLQAALQITDRLLQQDTARVTLKQIKATHATEITPLMARVIWMTDSLIMGATELAICLITVSAHRIIKVGGNNTRMVSCIRHTKVWGARVDHHLQAQKLIVTNNLIPRFTLETLLTQLTSTSLETNNRIMNQAIKPSKSKSLSKRTHSRKKLVIASLYRRGARDATKMGAAAISIGSLNSKMATQIKKQLTVAIASRTWPPTTNRIRLNISSTLANSPRWEVKQKHRTIIEHKTRRS